FAGSSSGDSYGTGVYINTNGDIIFSGLYSNSVFGSISRSGYSYVVSLNSSGTYQWATGFSEAINGISPGPNGLIYTTGFFWYSNTGYDIEVDVFDGANPDSDTYPSGFDNYDGDGDVCDSDDDNDGIIDTNDDCPLGMTGWVSSTSTDYDGDGCRDDYDEEIDADNDGIYDSDDNCPKGNLNWTSNSTNDHDSDGCRDSTEDSDDDNDGVSDSNDLCPVGAIPDMWPYWEQWDDFDGDGCRNSEDPDDDNDLILDAADSCSSEEYMANWNSSNSTDYDSDGCYDSNWEDEDDDNDGMYDGDDYCPRGNLNWTRNSITDYDSDGCEDASEDLDDDNDGVDDVDDTCPIGSSPGDEQWYWEDDPDGDGCANDEDIDDDGDSILDDEDDCNSNNWVNWNSNSLTDYDSDGCNDQNEDNDDDNDGVWDWSDTCALGELGWNSTSIGYSSSSPADWDLANSTDWDSDGCKDDGEDLDDDGDGVLDDVDSCPRGVSIMMNGAWSNFEPVNMNGISLDTDFDGDGCHDYRGGIDISTGFGWYIGEDLNDDNDAYLDVDDTCWVAPGTSNLTISEDVFFFGYDYQGDTLSFTISQDQVGCPDLDGDTWPSLVLDNNGYFKNLDMFENDSTQWWDSDGDGLGDNFVDSDGREDFWPGWQVSQTNNSDLYPMDRDNDGFYDSNLLYLAGLITGGEELTAGQEAPYLWDNCVNDPGSSMWSWSTGQMYEWKMYRGGCQDLDGDLFFDTLDWDPNDGTQWADTDSDGFGDNYSGFEGDGCPNTWGDSWRDRHGCVDGDRDGTSDFGDIFEKNATQWQDLDGDGFGDNWGDSNLNSTRPNNWPGQWIDSAFKPDPSPFDYDNDGFEDSQFGGNGPFDACPLVYGTSTIDQVGCPDADGDGYSDMGDMVPNDPTQWIDTDGDGFGDNVNGTMADSCPNQSGTSFRDAYGCTDSDGDGWSILMDFDDNSTNVWSDLDGDGYPDQPGFSNSDDCVNQAGNSTTPWKGCADIDGDGTMDIADLDADGDGITNALELQAGGALSIAFDIYNASSTPDDMDGDGMPDVLDGDTDGDGFPDDLERERGTNPSDAKDTPISQYGENTGIYYVPGDGFQSSYDPQGYELSVSALVFMLTSEFLLPLILLPASLFLVMRKGFRFKKIRRQLRDTTSIAQLEGAEEMIDNLILKNKVKVVHGVLLRNQFERCRENLKEKADAPVKRVRPPPAQRNY
ncbi:MAG: hypothetical protein CXT71_08025, partial [Methanobacteriota archaeon]